MMQRADDFANAGELVTTDPEVMGGTACFAGTRVPLEVVLASLDKGISMARVTEAYLFLTEAHVDAARRYLQVHPESGQRRRLRDLSPPSLHRSAGVVRAAKT